MQNSLHSKPCILIFCGLPATGKTSIALMMSQRIDISYIGTDILRDKMGLRGKYDIRSKKIVYKRLLAECKAILEGGNSVILEGTFHKKESRTPFIQLAEEMDSRILWIEIVAKEKVIKERLKRKRKYSEADYEVYKMMKKYMDPYPDGRIIIKSDAYSKEKAIELLQQKLPDDCQRDK